MVRAHWEYHHNKAATSQLHHLEAWWLPHGPDCWPVFWRFLLFCMTCCATDPRAFLGVRSCGTDDAWAEAAETEQSRAKDEPGSTGMKMRMKPDVELKDHLVALLNPLMMGPSGIMLLTGIHEDFQTTRSSFSPVIDVRSARISCTSHKKPSLELDDEYNCDEEADMVIDAWQMPSMPCGCFDAKTSCGPALH